MNAAIRLETRAPELVSRTSFKAIGISVRTTNHAEADPNTAKIPGLWQRFFRDDVLDSIPNKTSNSPIFGVYTNYEKDYSAPYDLIVSAEVTTLDTLPDGMVGVTIPSGNYLVFQARGQMPTAIINTWKQIWDFFSNTTQYKRSYSADFELHKSPSEADIYIAVN